MKKLIYTILCCSFCLVLFGCKTDNTKGTKVEEPKTTTAPKTVEAPADKESTEVPTINEEEHIPVTSTVGDCIYVEFKGLARIKSITDAPKGENNCPNAQLVEFSFGLINASDIKRYKQKEAKDNLQFLTLHDGLNPSKEWVDRNGIVVETVLQCTRKELFQGDCATKVFYMFSEVDTNPKEKCK